MLLAVLLVYHSGIYLTNPLMTMISSNFSSGRKAPEDGQQMVYTNINNRHNHNHKTMRKNYAPIKYTLRLSAAHYAHEYLFTFAHFVSLCYILGLARLIIRKKSIRMNFNLIICDGLRVFFCYPSISLSLRYARLGVRVHTFTHSRTCIQFYTESFR